MLVPISDEIISSLKLHQLFIQEQFKTGSIQSSSRHTESRTPCSSTRRQNRDGQSEL